ncbi:6-phosphogluconolactonase [Flavobacteriaceae bacterium M23B6Z8]
MTQKHIFSDKREVAIQFSSFLTELIFEKEETHIALSGGSTPKVIFDVLAENFANKINWTKVHLYWGDERCVPPGHEQSNYKMTVDHLLSKIEIPSQNIHRIQGESDPAEEAKRYSSLLREKLPEKNDIPAFDLIILGMGDDGHTASIFPHEIELWRSDKLCEVATHPDSGQKRITITGKVIDNANIVAFLVTGASKAEKVKSILQREKGYQQYPASLVAPASGSVYWFLDEKAAYLLREST